MAKDIVETEHYLPLTDHFEIDEYQIMERFCLSVDDEDMRMICVTPSVVEAHFADSKTGCSCMRWLKSGIGIVMPPCER